MAMAMRICALVIACDVLVLSQVPFTPVQHATQKLAVCMDGSPAGYYYSAGSGDGAKNWMVFLMGGGWCEDVFTCRYNTSVNNKSTKMATTEGFDGILSHHQHINPDFYNWNRIYVHYCDQASFLGDSEIEGFQFRGSRIFDAVVDELLAKGMNSAENVILAGRSAGGLATILHCDDFRARVSNTSRVKCVSDSGFFIRGRNLPNVAYREWLFASTISFHNVSSLLPKSCTEKKNPSLLRYNLYPENTPGWESWKICWNDLRNCSATDKKLLREYKKTFLNEVKKFPDIPSIGLFIHTCFTHSVTPSNLYWNISSPLKVKNTTIVEAVGNWYFDQSPVKLIDTEFSFPRSCS